MAPTSATVSAETRYSSFRVRFFEPTDASSHRSAAVANKQAFVFHANAFNSLRKSIERHNGRARSDFTSCNGF